MEFNWSIVGWIAGLVFVYFFGIFEGRSQGYKKRKREEQEEKKDQPAPQPETVTVTVDDPGLLRIKNEGGAYTLDLDGTRVNPTSLMSEQRKRLVEILGIMRPWLEGKPASAPSAITPPPPPAPPVQTPSTPVADARQDIPFRPASSAPLPGPQPASPPPPAGPQPIDPGSAGHYSPRSEAERESKPVAPPPAAPKPATIAKEDRPAAPANSIVAQIDSVLQARLAGTPLEGRGIFLTQSPEGGVNVYVGLTRYNGIDEVPDPEVKAAIRAAITEWENKYTPGLK